MSNILQYYPSPILIQNSFSSSFMNMNQKFVWLHTFFIFLSAQQRLLKVAVREQCKGFIGSRLILAPKSTSQGESCEEVLWETLESRSFYKLSSMCQVCKKQGFSQLSDQLAQTHYNFMELFAKKTSISNIKTSWMMLELYVACKEDSSRHCNGPTPHGAIY